MKIQFLFLVLTVACSPYLSTTSESDQSKVLEFKDKAYEPQIKTTRLHPLGNPESPAVVPLGQQSLQLSFDDLQTTQHSYYVRIEHCTYTWEKSTLQDLDYLQEYNEFPITQYEYSIDTHIPYLHYAFTIPPVKVPGNYLLVVYRSNKEDVVLSRRFMVYDTQILFSKDGKLITSGAIANLNQQLNFTLQYKKLQVQNALTDIHVVIRQNQRWDNLAVDLRPAFVREIEKEMEYRFFDDAQMFKGGNEFRFFDLRSLSNPGRNIASVNLTTRPVKVFIEPDKSRATEAYAQYPDLNGNFAIANYDFRNAAPYTNYADVNFTLRTEPIAGNVYVTGGFCDWNLTETNRMHYDSTQHVYSKNILLKQGWYDYQYIVQSPKLPGYYLEGSHFQTENFYEVFVYYRPFKPNADLLIGYVQLEENAR